MNQDQKKSYKAWVKSYIFHYWPASLVILVIGLISDAFVLVAPIPTKYLADYVFSDHTPPRWLVGIDKKTLLIDIVIAFVVINIASTIFSFISSLVTQKITQTVDKRSMLEAFDASNQIPVTNPNRHQAGTYLYQITAQALNMSGHAIYNGASIIQSVILLISVLFILFTIDGRMTVITFVTVPFLIVSVKFFGDALEKRSADLQDRETDLYNFVDETLNKLRTIQAYALEVARHNKLGMLVGSFHRTQRKSLVTDKLFGISTSIIIQAATTTVLIVGGIDAINGKLTFGDLLVFMSYMDNVFDPIAGIVNIMGTIREERAALLKVHKTIIDRDNLKLFNGNIKDIGLKGKIVYKDVSYTIGGNRVFENLNLELPAGSINAFVGPSGQGKSTMLNMILRFIEPSSGFVSVDGRQVKDYDLEFLRNSIAIIDQEPSLFNMSVAENISVSHPNMEYPLPSIMGQAYAANATGFISELPEKYETIIDNDRLSGGQKQRIAIARALFKQSPIVLMDEPTSALDDKSSKVFIENLYKYINGQTVIIVTHDLDLLAHIPNVYVVDKGKVTEINQLGGLDSYRKVLLKATDS